MLPTPGRIVLYHFEVTEPDGDRRMQARPAIVVKVFDGAAVELSVFLSSDDAPMYPGYPVVERPPVAAIQYVIPHHESGAEIGKAERMPPAHGTWTWPPRTP